MKPKPEFYYSVSQNATDYGGAEKYTHLEFRVFAPDEYASPDSESRVNKYSRPSGRADGDSEGSRIGDSQRVRPLAT
jgi:hypothetical protein